MDGQLVTTLMQLLHPFNGLLSRTTWVSRHQKGKPFWILLEMTLNGHSTSTTMTFDVTLCFIVFSQLQQHTDQNHKYFLIGNRRPDEGYLARLLYETWNEKSIKTGTTVKIFSHFYSARNARIASAVLAIAIPSVCPSVRPSVCLSVSPSVCHTPVLCQNDGT